MVFAGTITGVLVACVLRRLVLIIRSHELPHAILV